MKRSVAAVPTGTCGGGCDAPARWAGGIGRVMLEGSGGGGCLLCVCKPPAEGRGTLGDSQKHLWEGSGQQGLGGRVSLAPMLHLFMFPTSESREEPSVILFCRLPFLGITGKSCLSEGRRKKKKKKKSLDFKSPLWFYVQDFRKPQTDFQMD